MRLVAIALLVFLATACGAPSRVHPRHGAHGGEYDARADRPPLPGRTAPEIVSSEAAGETPPPLPSRSAPDGLRDALAVEDMAPVAVVSEDSPAARVLLTGQRMVDEKVIIRGSCWGWVDAVFNRAGFPARPGARETVFQGRQRGPYAAADLIGPGDWLYYINHSYKNVPHSGIFIRWVDRSRKVGLVLSYGGAGRKRPGRYREYDLSSVYRIVRPGG